MSSIDILSVVNKIVGPIVPVGETNEDKLRLQNLQEMIRLTDSLLEQIIEVREGLDSSLGSVCMAAKEANTFLCESKNILEQVIDEDQS